MHPETSRRAFCAGALALAGTPSLSFITVPGPTAGPDVAVIDAVAEWLRLGPVLTDLWSRRNLAYDASMALMGSDCPMGDVEANRAWHDTWNLTPCGKLEWEWERVARIFDDHMTFAVNTRAVTADGIAAKITLYRASLEYFEEDDDPYIVERIEADLAALSGLEA